VLQCCGTEPLALTAQHQAHRQVQQRGARSKLLAGACRWPGQVSGADV
jgi:hypothetical protein